MNDLLEMSFIKEDFIMSNKRLYKSSVNRMLCGVAYIIAAIIIPDGR